MAGRAFTPKSTRLLAILCLSGCAGFPSPQHFDVDTENDQPTVQTIVREIRCELVKILNDKGDPTTGRIAYGEYLVRENFGFAADLDLEVQDTGALAPSFTYTATSELAIDAGFKFSKSRTQTFSTKIEFNLADLKRDVEKIPELGVCPKNGRNNLDYDLGIAANVMMGLSHSGAVTSAELDTKGGLFGGSVAFVITSGLDSSGPTWTLTRLKGPGKLASYSRQYTDKVIFAFAVEAKEGVEKGGKKGKPKKKSVAPNSSTYLEKLTIKDISNQIQGLKLEMGQ